VTISETKIYFNSVNSIRCGCPLRWRTFTNKALNKMLSQLFFVLVVATFSQVCLGANLRTQAVVSSCQITEYILALQDDCGFESIHGLWPDPEDTCTNCTSEAFDESKLTSSTLSDMNKYWPTCVSGNTNEDFWSHEWSKHGTCTGMSQEDYFSQAISLYKKYVGDCTTDCYVCLTPTFGYEGVNVC
jgi:hypothetical protein